MIIMVKRLFEFEENWISVTIPFNYINVVNYQPKIKVDNDGGKQIEIKLNKTQEKIIKLLRNDSNTTSIIIMKKLGLGHSAVSKNLIKLQKIGIIERIGSKKGGYWKVND